MGENLQITKRQIIYLLGGVLVAAFLGIMAGSYFIRWKNAEVSKPGANFLLKAGQVFPEYQFAGLNGEQSNLYQSLEGKKSVLIFLTTECGHCVHVVSRWDSVYSSISRDYQVVGISYEPVEKLKSYQTEKKVLFPLYNDPNGKFTGQYKFDSYPTILGINEKREIVFVEFGNNPRRKVEDYLKLL